MILYDYIYVDLEKVISLYSQLTGGVIELIEKQSEKGVTSDNKRNYDFKVFKHHAGGTSQDKSQNKATIKPYHSLLQELEEKLMESGFSLDIAAIEGNKTLKDKEIRNTLKQALCVKCSGRVVIEDYERMKKIAQDIPNVVKLINKSQLEALLKTAEVQEVKQRIQSLENKTGNTKERAQAKREATEIRKALEGELKALKTTNIEQWILDGVETWIDTFLSGIVSIRVYPFGSESDEHVFGHLESSNFTTPSTAALHYTYGTFPTEKFTVLGVVTSVPMGEEDTFKPLREFERKDGLSDYETVEKGFRGLFDGFNGFESIIRTCRYPRVLIHPVLVYREVEAIKSLESTE